MGATVDGEVPAILLLSDRRRWSAGRQGQSGRAKLPGFRQARSIGEDEVHEAEPLRHRSVGSFVLAG
jgi:hypothetical protein